MKKIIAATFSTRENAELAISHLHENLNITTDDISYLYRNTEGEVREVDASEVGGDGTSDPVDGAVAGASTGGVLGAIAGIVAVVAAIPAVGPIFVAGPLIAALGITGAAGTVAAGAATGALAGGVIGALVNWGVGEDEAKEYADRVNAGDILVVVHSEDGEKVADSLRNDGGMNVDIYAPRV